MYKYYLLVFLIFLKNRNINFLSLIITHDLQVHIINLFLMKLPFYLSEFYTIKIKSKKLVSIVVTEFFTVDNGNKINYILSNFSSCILRHIFCITLL